VILYKKDNGVKARKCPRFEFKPRQVNDSSQSNQGTDQLVSHKYTLVHNGKKITLLPLMPNEIVQCDRVIFEITKR
jgi:hypothetical protein